MGIFLAIDSLLSSQPSPDVDPFERWSQLASLGQTRGLTTRETALNSEGQPTFGANSSNHNSPTAILTWWKMRTYGVFK